MSILIVEDDPFVANTSATCLENRAFAVAELASPGSEPGLQCCRGCVRIPDRMLNVRRTHWRFLSSDRRLGDLVAVAGRLSIRSSVITAAEAASTPTMGSARLSRCREPARGYTSPDSGALTFQNARQRAAARARRDRSRAAAYSSNAARSAAATKPWVGRTQAVGHRVIPLVRMNSATTPSQSVSGMISPVHSLMVG